MDVFRLSESGFPFVSFNGKGKPYRTVLRQSCVRVFYFAAVVLLFGLTNWPANVYSSKGIEMPVRERSQVPPNQEEIKLDVQRLRKGKAELLISLQLPARHRFDPNATHDYQATIASGTDRLLFQFELFLEDGTSKKDAGTTWVYSKTKKMPSLIRLPLKVLATGPAVVTASVTFVYCRVDRKGVCRTKTLRWYAPVEVVDDAKAPARIRLSGKVGSE